MSAVSYTSVIGNDLEVVVSSSVNNTNQLEQQQYHSIDIKHSWEPRTNAQSRGLKSR